MDIYAIGTWAASTSVYFVRDTIEWRGTYVLDRDNAAYMKVETAINLPVQIRQNSNYADTVLEPGTVLSFVETDAESYILFVLNDGTEGIIEFEWNSDWIETIDGVPAYEYFKELPLFG